MTSVTRYPGSRSFQDTDVDRLVFFGREREKMALFHLVLAEDLVLLYAKSGTGKTSLLNAGVLEPLRGRDYFPIMLRLTGPTQQPATILEQVAEAAKVHGVEVEPLDGIPPGLSTSFNAIRFWRGDVLLAPILVFDQFEELFTVTPPPQRQAFIEDFALLARPERSRPDPGRPAGAGPRPKIVLSMREDYLGELEELAAVVPRVMAHRFRLTALTREQAEEAIVSPAASHDPRIPGPRFTFEPDAVRELLDFLCTQPKNTRSVTRVEVEPFQLQILCHHIEDKVRERGVNDGNAGVVRAQDLGGCKGMESILHGFYVSKLREFDENDREAIRRLCERGLISESGKRLSLEEEQIERQFGVGRLLLARLIEQRLLRADPRTGSTYYELSHDTLVGPILRERGEHDPEGLVRDAEANRIGGNYEAAMHLFERAVALQPSHVVANVQWATMLMQHGRVEEAGRILSSAMEKGLAHESAHHVLGRIFAAKGDHKAAIDQYMKALKLNDRLAVVHADLATAYREDSKPDQAAKSYARSIQLDPQNAETHRNLALLFIAMRQFDRAMETFRTAAEVNPEFGYIFQDLAKGLVDNQQHDLAKEVCRIVLKLDSRDHALYRGVGYQLLELREFEASLEAFARSAMLEPNDAWTYFAWSIALFTAGRPKEGNEKIEKAVQLDPVNVLSVAAESLIERDAELAATLYERAAALAREPSVLFNWGRALWTAGKPEEAEGAYRKALEIAPAYAPAVNGLALVERRRGRFQQAETLFRSAIELAPSEAAYVANLGDLLRGQRGRWDESEAAYKRALEIDPKNTAAMNGLAQIARGQDRIPDAELLLRRAIELAPSEPALVRNLADLLRETSPSRWDEAEAAYQKALALNPRDTAALNNFALIHQERGRTAEAEALFIKAMELDPRDPLYPRNLGDLLRDRTNRWDEAETYYQRALTIDPNDFGALNGQALLERARGRVDAAEPLFRQLMEKAPGSPLYPRNLGDLLRTQTRRWDEAEAAYKQALERDPKYGPAFNGLGLLHKARGNRAEAETAFRQAMQCDAREPAYPRNLGNLLSDDKRRWDDAEAALKEALDLDPQNPGSLYDLAVFEQNRGRGAEAEKLYRRAMETAPADPDYPRTLGHLLREAKRWDEAEEAYNKALDLDRNNPATINALAVLAQERGQIDDAGRLFRAAMALDPNEPLYPRNLGDLLRQSPQHWDEAEAAYRNALQIDQNYGPAINGLGLLEQARGRTDAAERLFRSALALAPSELIYANNLVELIDAARPDDAEAVLRKFLDDNPSSAEAYNSLAWTLRTREGRLHEAWELARRAAEMQPEAEILHTFADLSVTADHPQAMNAVTAWLGACSIRFPDTYRADTLATFRKVLRRGRVEELISLMRWLPTVQVWASWIQALEAVVDRSKVSELSPEALEIHQALLTES